MTNTETAGAGAPSDRPMQHDEALQRAGLVAIRMGREGDIQAAETVRAQIARIQALEADNQTLRTGYDAARLEIESLNAQLHAAKQINAAQFGLLAASIPGSALPGK